MFGKDPPCASYLSLIPLGVSLLCCDVEVFALQLPLHLNMHNHFALGHIERYAGPFGLQLYPLYCIPRVPCEPPLWCAYVIFQNLKVTHVARWVTA